MVYSELYKGYTIKGSARNYRAYDPAGNQIGLRDRIGDVDYVSKDTLGGLRKQIRERIDELIEREHK